MTLTHMSIFTGSGIGDLAAEQAGFTTVAQCEREPDCLFALAKLFPDAERFDDVRSVTVDALRARGIAHLDLLSGGPPCQAASSAGKRQGAKDLRWMWPDTVRIVREVRPSWFVFENVRGFLSLPESVGVIRDLEEAGYEVWPLLLSAADFGAPHKRERVWIVGRLANAECLRSGSRRAECEGQQGRVASVGASLATMGDTEPMRELQSQGSVKNERGWTGNPSDAAMAYSSSGQDNGRASRSMAEAQGCGQRGNATVGTGREDELADPHEAGQREQRGAFSVSPELAATERIRFDRWPARPGEEQFEWEEPRVVADAAQELLQWRRRTRAGRNEPADEMPGQTQSRLGLATHGLAGQFLQTAGISDKALSYAPIMGKVRKIETGSEVPTRCSLLRTLGNAWVPQIPLTIFKWIREQIA